MSNWIMEYKAEVLVQYRSQKEMADAALGRCSDAMFFARLRVAATIIRTASPSW